MVVLSTPLMIPLRLCLSAIFSFFFVFILTSIAFLRERSQGTIERVMASPMTRTELVIGYILGFMLFALVQSMMILLFVIYALRVHYSGNLSLSLPGYSAAYHWQYQPWYFPFGFCAK